MLRAPRTSLDSCCRARSPHRATAIAARPPRYASTCRIEPSLPVHPFFLHGRSGFQARPGSRLPLCLAPFYALVTSGCAIRRVVQASTGVRSADVSERRTLANPTDCVSNLTLGQMPAQIKVSCVVFPMMVGAEGDDGEGVNSDRSSITAASVIRPRDDVRELSRERRADPAAVPLVRRDGIGPVAPDHAAACSCPCAAARRRAWMTCAGGWQMWQTNRPLGPLWWSREWISA